MIRRPRPLPCGVVRQPLRALFLVLVVLAPAAPAFAAKPLTLAVPNILRAHGLAGGGTGVTIVDLSTGRVA